MQPGETAQEADTANAATFSAFEDKAIRLGFIRKVYGILSVQLLVTFSFVIVPSVSDVVKDFVKANHWMIITAAVLGFATLITLACCEYHRTFPINLICLGIFTLTQSFLLMNVGAYINKPEVLMWAVIITFVICLALTVFAFQTKFDFTIFNGILFVFLVVLVVMGIILLIVGRNRIFHLIYASLGAFIFSAYLVIDTQMIVGGSHKYQYSPEDYIFAAINLYLDIINLFLMILRILQFSKS
ncbi:lifeguard-like protein [Dinothrombium tinctorium]|uniref:Lifeguard-like protein n=1 Tax=Dinothrombium tinctorium TaxID=1965070 RepID=A0A3S3QBN2_9ACAR|nr:lifeguard-like protein [Dinothrombium tinctorium]RWS17306.1 lifeguard-like protein [Dinothrombium tinctorium]